jgi:Heterokaryon incompatibility protein (HET)
MSRYQQLPITSRQIRVLVIAPGSGSQAIRAILKVVSLDDSPPYAALSYVWGQTTADNIIDIPGFGGVKVTDNLLAALRRIRQESTWLMVWVDAICIDQENIPERNAQVRIMKDIYAGARSVYVWLGQRDDDTEDALRMMTGIARLLVTLSSISWRRLSLKGLYDVTL